MSRTTRVAALLAFVLATAGCGTGEGDEAAEAPAEAASAAADAPAEDTDAGDTEAGDTEAVAASSEGGEAPAGGSGYTVGVEYNTLAVPFVGAVQRGIQEQAEELGVEIVERDPQADTSQQAADIEELLTREPDGLIVAGNGEAETLGAVRPAIAADVPIVAMISQIGTHRSPSPSRRPSRPRAG